MPVAYVMINTREFDPQILKEVRSINGVEEAHALYGVYDIIAKTKADTMNRINQIHNKIRKLKGITSTLTMIAHED
jgi:DNA-binding Lrp family transcriptional regulator